MTKYRLLYFAVRARGEPARQLFALAGVPFEDHRITRDEWTTIKPTTPFGQIPVLYVDEKPLAQSKAIYRYLAKEFSPCWWPLPQFAEFAGDSSWEASQIDQIGDHIEDFRNLIRPFIRITNHLLEGDRDKFYIENVEAARDSAFPPLERFLADNPSGFLVGAKVSWVDLWLADLVDVFVHYKSDFVAKYPQIAAHRTKIQSIPAIKLWLQTRPKTDA